MYMAMKIIDETKCKEVVHFHQCSRKIWKDGYCKQHHPDSISERHRKSNERYEAAQEKSPWRLLEKATNKNKRTGSRD
jgi:hypothetical protein